MAKVSTTKKELKKNLAIKNQPKNKNNKSKPVVTKATVKKTVPPIPAKKIVNKSVKPKENNIPFLLLTPEEVVTKIKNLFKKKPKQVITKKVITKKQTSKKLAKITKKKSTGIDKIKSLFIKPKQSKKINKKQISKKTLKVTGKKVTIIDKIKSLFNKKPVKQEQVKGKQPKKTSKQTDESKKELSDFFITSDLKFKNKIILVVISFLFGLLIGFIPFINYKSSKGVVTDNKEDCSYTDWVREDVKYCIVSTDGKYYESEYMKYERLPDLDKCVRYTRRKKC